MKKIRIENIAKTDINMITDMHLKEMTNLMKRFTVKLYSRNPKELRKTRSGSGGNPSRRFLSVREEIDARLEQIYRCPPAMEGYPEIHHKVGVDAMLLGFHEDFEGDRVFAVMYGLYSMVMITYNNQCELFIVDQLDQQRFYDSARNIEIFAWRLKTRAYPNNEPFLLTNGTAGDVLNLSFERLLGKMISLQDMMARIVADRTNRLINKVIYTAGMAFFPIRM